VRRVIVIGLGHKARQGKNYVANYMQQAYEAISFYAFADELKRYCKEHHDELEPQWQLAHQTKQKPAFKDDPIYGCTPILQWYGTDIARKADPDTWVKAVAQRIESEQPTVAIITDVRFPNEAQFVKEKAGYLVEVIRRNADGSQYRDPGRDPNHPSETALDDYLGWDFTIMCKDGDLEALEAKSKIVLSSILRSEGDKLVNASGFDLGNLVGSYQPDNDATGFKS